MVDDRIPDRGDIVWLDFNPVAGHEQAGKRPALVLSRRYYNKTGLLLACPITSKVKGFPFEVRITQDKIDGVVLANHVRSLDWQARRASLGGRAPKSVLGKTQELLETLIQG